MPTKECKVCGKRYEACPAYTRSLGAFRFKDVVCSPECFDIWLKRVEESRKPAKEILEEVLAETPVFEESTTEETPVIPCPACEVEEEEDMEIDC